MGHVDLSAISYHLPDGRVLLDDISFRVGEGAVVALVGANGSGKTTLLKIIAGDLAPTSGSVSRSGGLGVMRQFIGSIRDHSTVRDLLFSLAPPRLQHAVAEMDALELALMEDDSEPVQLRYAQALADYADAGGYDAEVTFDVCTTAAIGIPYDRAKWREVNTLSGGEQKRLALEALLRGPDEVLLLDEPDNYLDVPGKRWLEEQLAGTQKSVLLVSHDRELLAQAATRIAALELGAAGNTVWVHGGGYATFGEARRERFDRLDELRRRWDEEHEKLRQLMLMYKNKAAYNSGMASRYRAAQTRLAKFEEAGPPQELPREQHVKMRLTGGRTGKRAIVVDRLELTGLMKPFSAEIWFGDRVAVLGSNGSGKSHFLRLLARGGSHPDIEHLPVDDLRIGEVAHTGSARLGARVRPGWFAQTHHHPELVGRTLLEILHRGNDHRTGMGREEASRKLDRYELAYAAEQRFDTLSGGQQARFQILLLELSGATLLLLDEPTDNLDIESAEALEHGLESFEGTVVAVTHDRWFARGFDRFLVFGADGSVYESDEPVWDETRVQRAR
ncbi:ABC-F family ATP-binding cassette domain-containing protein [Microlunatus ginsengisoli]|uniref:ATP-binding cassette domain-containing protein n=1 Tax=Microlunatus ginsengisoli TaxID=363863 RepID=A0ABP6ZUK5_9ACTN